jgi:hypothetical protein
LAAFGGILGLPGRYSLCSSLALFKPAETGNRALQLAAMSQQNA